MIDFRYHIVSLGAVFIALAVGIILGAGPLQNSIGETLSNEVTALKETNSELRSENDALRTDLTTNQELLQEALPALLVDTSIGQNVVLISLPNTTSEDIASATETVNATGAKVVGVVRLTTAWVDQDASAYRTALAEQLRTHLESYKVQNKTTFPLALDSEEQLLSAALAQILTSETADTELTQTIRGLLTNAEKPLIEFEVNLSTPASVAIVLSPKYATDESVITDEEKTALEAAAITTNGEFITYISAITSLVPVVASGYAESAADFVTVARENGALQVTTDSFAQTSGQINLGLSIPAAVNKTTLHAGSGIGATTSLAKRVVLPPVETSAETAN
ncbi:MAG: copper transporter [Arcanobacterium sp.]|nr:copper transporter [Arcanobacterium sp.]